MSALHALVAVRTVVVHGDMSDRVLVWQRFLEAIGELSVTVMATAKHDFPRDGLTGVVVLAESHAAIHTWPERECAWCELATCGDPKDLERFVVALRRLGDVEELL